MGSLKWFLKKKNYTAVTLTLSNTNHMEIIAKINGVSGRFILDTGASNTCVAIEKADQFHLKAKQSKVLAAGAGAIGMETQKASKNTLSLGDWTYEKTKIVLFDLSHVNQALMEHKALPVDGIIGADILKKGKAVIDYKRNTLFLKQKKGAKK